MMHVHVRITIAVDVKLSHERGGGNVHMRRKHGNLVFFDEARLVRVQLVEDGAHIFGDCGLGLSVMAVGVVG